MVWCHLKHHNGRCLDTICPLYSRAVSTGKSQRALLDELPSWASSAVHVNTPAPEHILAERKVQAAPILQCLEQGFSPQAQQNPPNCSYLPRKEYWYPLPPDAGTQDCPGSHTFCVTLAVSYRSERSMSNCYSLDLRMYLQSGDSLFPPRLQMTANVAANSGATSSPQNSAESLGNGLLCDHWQADLLSGRSEWYWSFPQRVFLSKPYKWDVPHLL